METSNGPTMMTPKAHEAYLAWMREAVGDSRLIYRVDNYIETHTATLDKYPGERVTTLAIFKAALAAATTK